MKTAYLLNRAADADKLAKRTQRLRTAFLSYDPKLWFEIGCIASRLSHVARDIRKHAQARERAS